MQTLGNIFTKREATREIKSYDNGSSEWHLKIQSTA